LTRAALLYLLRLQLKTPSQCRAALESLGIPNNNMNQKDHSTPLRTLARAAMIVLLTGVATVAFAQSNGSGNGKKYVATKEIVFDQATQKLRKPTAEEITAMVAQISTLTNRTSEGLTAKTLANGTKQVNLQGRFGGVVLGRANADGTTEIRCVTTMNEAVQFLGLEEVQ
jgi:hypothetical protein